MTSNPTPLNPPQQLKRHPRLFIGLGILGLLLGLSVARMPLTATPPEEADTVSSQPLPVEVLTVEPVTSYSVSRAYTGEIAALRTSELGFERSGRLVDVLAKEGDRVVAGQPLARLDISNLQTQRQQLVAERSRVQAQLAELQAGPRLEGIAAAEAAVQELEQQLALQQTQRSRRESLYAAGAISKEELDEFTFGQGALQARLDQAQSRLQELRNGTRQEQIAAQLALVQQLDASLADLDVTIGKSTLTAAFDGIVAARQVDEGTVVNAGQSVVRLVENAAPEARIGLPTEAASQLQIGSAQTLRLGSETYSATVTALLPEIDPDTRTQGVLFALEPSAISRLSPGQTVRVELAQTIPADGVWLPIESLTQGIRGLWDCYVLMPTEAGEDTYQVQPQAVEILHQEGSRVLARGTLQPGDRIVASGTHRLVPGQRVRPMN
ncbi:efflux RND transporter periplasmic adaptor subunit [Pseudanabaena sp. FACHB-2040]|uniref:efflux RND transporter periplasmic adaptor subunit n=1 Tax=Pseudanabaena sp. FACHB-2040 TaxID=2692859 RepID=UPI0016873237|nr:efflux RND transporter periplasmic adaptor subunit [Pseudanabaena sp. FACHB-2040]MBD2258276.1 efflux RND transporter periplasmic adaptor subunit [Pseudanabaena sp. FACHB-2040]